MIKKIVLFLIPIVIVVAAIFIFRSGNFNSDLPRKIDYNFHVRPILSDKCFACHGPDESKRKSGLRLDNSETAYAVLKDQPNEYAIIPGKPNHSHLIRRIFSEDSTERMPPPEFNLKLTDREKNIIYKWIEQGAEYKPHWSFVKPEKQDLPQVENKEWIKNAIDYYIVGKLEEIGLEPNEIADKDHLLKRVSFDITGLPPTPELHEEFINDKSENAYEKVVDKLLSMPQYGEKMAVHWLDVARYADSHGYQDDGLRTMWPWRDWVIHAFNENYPYDKFVTWQLAGDLLPERTKESLLATGFNRNHKITQEGGVIDEEYRIEYVTDRTNTFGKAFLGMTFECAKCHDHKYDPISKNEYYSTFAFFNRVPEKGIFGTIDASFADPPNMKITSNLVQDELSFINLKDSSVDVMVMKDSVNLRKTFVLNRGAYDQPTDEVDFGTPEDILKFDTTLYEKNRLGLAKWLFDENNPLTARVYVNRVWQEIFGRGLVRTSGDFGMQGEFPSHPELLDYLALDFRNNHWDIKYLIKKIVTSATYMQSAVVHEEKYTKDPDNIYFSRYKRMRLSAEEIRDHALASSGLLNPEIGGPSVKPYQPEGLWESATSGRGTLQAYVQDKGKDLYRRGMYTFIKRTVPPPGMLIFDASNRDQCEVRRLKTTTPLQALIMLNDPTILEASRVMAERFIASGISLEESIRGAYLKILCRIPEETEMKIMTQYYESTYLDFQKEPEKASEFLKVGEYPGNEVKTQAVEMAALMQLIHTVYNLEEAITKS